MSLLSILLLVIIAGIVFYISNMISSAMCGSTGTFTEIRRVETTCIHCRRMRKFTRRGIYR